MSSTYRIVFKGGSFSGYQNENITREIKEDDWYPDKVALKVTKIISKHQFLGEATEDSMKEELQKGDTLRVDYDKYQEYRYDEASSHYKMLPGRIPEVGKTFTISLDGAENSQGEKKISVNDIDVFEEENA